FSIGNFKAIKGDFDNELLNVLYQDSFLIDSLSINRKLALNDVQEFAPSHLARISQRQQLQLNQSFDYIYDSSAAIGIDIIIIDTGINKKHPEFTGRVKRIANFVRNENQYDDYIGHGSAIAGVIGSETYGVAKKCNFVDIKVTDKNGDTYLADVLSALNLSLDHAKQTKRPTLVVLAMSLSKNSLLNHAVENLISNGIPVVVAAGNKGKPACHDSPASAKGVLVVGSINDKTDRIAHFSNWGACLDVFASGVNVITTGKRNDDITIASGTSISAGIAAGLVASFMAMGDTGLDAVERVKSYSTKDSISGLYLKPFTPNKLLFN
ncbi:S8 family peptidase, partial [Ascoidea rubescens DSM 1968]